MAFDPSSAIAVDEQPRQFDPSTAAPVEKPSLAQDIGRAAVGAIKGLIPHSVGDLIKMFTYTPLEDVGTQIAEPFKIAAEAQRGTPLLEAAQRARPDIPITGTREQKLESVIGGALQAGIVGLGAKLPTLKETLFGKAERPFIEPTAPTSTEQATGEVINRATQERQVQEGVPTERPRDDTGRTPAAPSVSGGIQPTTEIEGEAPVAEPTAPKEVTPVEEVQKGEEGRREAVLTVPKQVQRVEEVGAAKGTVDKPHGLYTTPADVTSPHAELGGEKQVLNTNPDANVLHLDATDFVRTNRGLAGQSAGIGALRKLVPDAESLMKMSKSDLKSELSQRAPEVDWGRYYDQHEMLEGYAGMEARKQGYDAIYAVDRNDPAFNEYVGLTEKAFQKETPPSPAARITTAVQHEGQILEGKSPTEMHADIGEQHGIGEPPENERGFVVHEPDGSTRFVGREEGGKLADAEGLRSKEFEGKPLASEHLQGRAAEVEPPPTTPPGAPITTGEPSPQPKVGGVNAAALAERPIETPERGEVFSREEGVRLGNVWLDKGGDPQKIINHFNKTGEIGPTNMGRMTAALLRKQAATDFAKDALRDNPTDPALKTKVDAALADEQAFSDAYKPMHTVASANLRSLQGKQALTEEMAQSYSGLERAYQEQTGKQFTPEQSQRAAKLSEQSKGLNQEYKAGNENVLQTADREYSRIRAVKKTTTLDDLVAVLTEPLKEVC